MMSLRSVKQTITRHYDDLVSFLDMNGIDLQLPLYSSADIRMNDVKAAVIDMNLFPAGFNNLCRLSYDEIPLLFKKTVSSFLPNCKRILILAENHTRNTFYLENVFALKTYLEDASYEVDVASLFDDLMEAECKDGFTELETATGNHLLVYNLEFLQDKLSASYYDFVLLNNDLIQGVPDMLKEINVPIYPSLAAGWHSRNKSHHFQEVNRIMEKISAKFDIDPFFLTTFFVECSNCNINDQDDRLELYEKAKELFSQLELSYRYYGIDQKPHVFIKANSGSYGMGVISIDSPQAILDFNRKQRNQLTKGKQGQVINNLILQEGIPSSLRINNQVAELCLYFASRHYLGGFFRLNSEKSDRDNLNSRGMSFQKMCVDNNTDYPSDRLDMMHEYPIIDDLYFYRFLGLVSVYAAQQEIKQLENSYV
ncbi:MAG: glutamate--cysteine ligase [Rickettsiales bacterium]|nr:glutamate--cysteine ligase [Rickettsiales bacterium]|tara:strand:+ start:6874 stop:8148 length:1275 start_codon:yes stop_codon:yes gene_type:complete